MNNQANHTPGPWRITNARDDKHGSFYIRGIDEHGSDMPLCVTRHGPEEANARLIAAAPELLEALTVLVKMASDGDVTTNELNLARAAIAKAQGGGK